ncbi:MAG: flagellar protein FlgN [Bacillota bacterium]
MEQLVDAMIGTLDQQVVLYEDLYSLSQKKHELLVGRDLQALDKVVSAEELLLLKAGRLEERRMSLQREIATRLGMDEDTTTLDQMAKALDTDRQAALSSVKQQLFEVFEKLALQNQMNMELIVNSLRYIDFSIRTMTGGQTDSAQAIFDKKA